MQVVKKTRRSQLFEEFQSLAHMALQTLELVVLTLLLVVALFSGLAQRFSVPYPVVLLLAGLAAGLITGSPQLELRPEFVFTIFLPPLLFAAAWQTSWREFKFNLVSISMLAVGLVLFTTVGVAWFAQRFFTGFDWKSGFLLGAVISTTDSIAASSIAKRLGLPGGVIDTIEGESLVNDATGLLMLAVGIQQLSTVRFSVGHDLGQFFWLLFGGIGIGVVSAFIATKLVGAILQGPNAIALTLVAAYGSYFAADVAHASGIISVVACGLYMSRTSSVVLSPITRLQAGAVWETIEFALNGLAFILTGLQLPTIWHAIHSMSLRQAVAGSFILTGVLIVLRMSWMYPSSHFSYWIRSQLLRQVCEAPDGKTIFLMGWTGMRGVVALAAASSLPIVLPNGQPFTQRPVIILLTFGVIVLTLVLQGLSLEPFIRRFNLSGTNQFACEAGEARRLILRKAICTLEERRDQDDPTRGHDYADALHQYEHLFESVLDCSIAEHKTLERGLFRHEVMLAAVQSERAELISLRSQGRIGDPVFRTIERELDLQESRLLSLV